MKISESNKIQKKCHCRAYVQQIGILFQRYFVKSWKSIVFWSSRFACIQIIFEESRKFSRIMINCEITFDYLKYFWQIIKIYYISLQGNVSLLFHIYTEYSKPRFIKYIFLCKYHKFSLLNCTIKVTSRKMHVKPSK